MPIGQGVKLIARAHQGLASFWGDPSWASKKQNSVALYTAEAEYMAACHCCSNYFG
jgi:hypothetical protein